MAASNWHWRSLGVKKGAEEWLREQILPLEAAGLSVTRVDAPEGDCEVASRKGRLLTIYDLRVEVRWQASAADGENIEGTLICPELAHDMSEDEYRFESACDKSSKEAEDFRQLAAKDLANKLRPVFAAFPKALLDNYGSVLRAQADAPNGTSKASATDTAAKAGSSSAAAVQSSASAASSATVNTSTIRLESEFQATAETLFELLTDSQKVPMWSRNPAKIQPEKGAEISLFNGNITGEMQEVDRPRSFVSTWRAPTWPAGHFARLQTSLKQGADSTTMELRLVGVPKGEEDATERNLDVFYMRSLKSIGLGSLIGSVDDHDHEHGSVTASDVAKSRSGQVVYGLLPFLFSFVLIVGLASAILLGPSGRGLFS